MPENIPAGLARFIMLVAIMFTGVVPLVSAPPASAAVGEHQRIAYLDRNNDVWVVDSSGDEAVQLTSSGGFSDVQWSSDGTRIVASGPYQGGTGVFVMSQEPGFQLRSLSSGHSPVWSPDSRRFSFIEGDDIHIFDRDGNYQLSVTTGADRLYWGPDGNRIAYTQAIADPYGVGCPINAVGWVDASTGTVESATFSVGPIAWGADADRIMHVSASDATVRAYSIENEGSTFLSSRVANPCRGPFETTPNGEELLLLESRGDARDLIAINVETGDERVFHSVPVDFPARVLPDAYVTIDQTSRYVFLARSYPTDIHRLDLNTGQVEPIVTGDWRRAIGVSPDGNYYALLHVPTGQALEITIRDRQFNESVISNAGWMNWLPSPINRSSALAWRTTQQREDRPIASGQVSRTWLWGPEPFAERVEVYDQSPGGFRAVRYYDKSRMEITHPAGDRSSEWYVTNGLLVRELITGRMQVGDDRFLEHDPSSQPVAGDVNDPLGPSYATMAGLLHAPALQPGDEIRQTINREGDIGEDGPEGIIAAHFVPQTEHTVADVFWNYLNSTGPVWNGEETVDGRLFEPTFFATGLPITEAYWSTVQVGGEPTEVLIQCFERRCLTYTPDNPDGWQVEMGNVGRHYYNWRYQ